MLIQRVRLGRRWSAGFTLVELMVTIALLAILLRLALPSFTGMLRNMQVRTVADALQNGLRSAQSEALRRNRQTVFTLTNGQPALDTAADDNGRNWQIHTVARAIGDGAAREFVQGGVLSDVASGVNITGTTAICFSSSGRLLNNPTPGVSGADCDLDAGPIQYDVTTTGGDRPLRVQVSPNGRVRMCDPAKTYSSSQPDGC